MIILVGVQVYLHQRGIRIVGLPDPAGGYFDAAGDFDRFLPADTTDFPMLAQVDPHGDLDLDQPSMPPLLHELDQLLPVARPGPEHDGLIRLRTLARYCAGHPEVTLSFTGE
jgi:hypothetical protein